MTSDDDLDLRSRIDIGREPPRRHGATPCPRLQGDDHRPQRTQLRPSRIWLAIATFSVVLLAGLATLTSPAPKRPSCLRGSIAAVLTDCAARP